MKKIIFFAFAFFFLRVCAGSGYGSDETEYEAMLTKLLQVSSRDLAEDQIKLLNDSRQACLDFSRQYPDSEYADDSRFIYGLVEFIGALLVPPRDINGANQMVSFMDQTVTGYPGGKVEELTYSILRRELGEEAVGGAFYIPYAHIVEYMRGLMAFHTRDYKTAIEDFSGLKSAMAPIEDEAVALEIYVPLYISYIRTGRVRDARVLAEEAADLYQGSSLAQTLEQIDARESNKKNNN